MTKHISSSSFHATIVTPFLLFYHFIIKYSVVNCIPLMFAAGNIIINVHTFYIYMNNTSFSSKWPTICTNRTVYVALIFAGHSTSVAHLVDNELPISTLHSPMGDGLIKMPPSINGDNDDDDDDNIENLSNRNNLSGSYSNLFREKLDDDDDNPHSSKDLQMLSHLATDTVVGSTASTLGGSGDGMLHGENVYSNIPHTSGGQMAVSMVDSGIGDKSDPNLHVYSNVEPPLMMNSASSTKLNDISFGDVSEIGVLPMVEDSFACPIGSSSTMLADDLDLDDPVSVAGTFGQMPKKTQTGRSNVATNNTKLAKSISIEMKNVIPQVVVLDAAVDAGGVAQQSGAVSASSANAFCSPSRMRLLHDTTMIDTALDLDSLDGSSLGNSQACLVKTAIV